MRRPSNLDKALIAILVPLWAISFGLCIRTGLGNGSRPPVYVSPLASPQSYPTVVGFKAWVEGSESELRIGDQLLRIGSTDLRGMDPLAFVAEVSDQARSNPDLSVAVMRGDERHEATLSVSPAGMFIWPLLPASLAYALTGVLLLLRASPSPLTRSFFRAFMITALVTATTLGGSRLEVYYLAAVYFSAISLVGPLALRGALLFPHDIPPSGRLARWGPWIFVLIGPFEASRVFGIGLPPEIGTAGFFALNVILFSTIVIVTSRAYRRADPIGRRKVKWVMLGLYCAAILLIVPSTMAVFDPRLTAIAAACFGGTALVPISFVIAITRFNFLDVDRLISATASYNIVIVVAASAGLMVVPPLASAAADLAGADPMMGQTVLSMLLVAALVPVNRRIRPHIDHYFFPESYSLEQGVDELLHELSNCQSAEELTDLAAKRLDALLHPETCSFYVHEGDTYVPVSTRGSEKVAAFKTNSALVAALRERQTPLTTDGGSHGRGGASGFERAALEMIGVPLVMPIHRGNDLVEFVCLGPKRSGDVYTSTDVSLLSAVAEKIASQLEHFDAAGAGSQTLHASAAAPSEGLVGLQLANRYRVESLLGEGGMATVYLANDVRLERPVVVKIPHASLLAVPGFLERFSREVRSLTMLEHPSIVQVYDFGEHRGVPFAVVQFLRGGDLSDQINRLDRAQSAQEVDKWLGDVAAALDYIHASGFLHRDVKPDNILFDERGHAFLSDFGIVTAMSILDPDAETELISPNLTGTGVFIGSAAYAPPEWIERRFSGAYDQYSLGGTVYMALSLSRPFEDHGQAMLLAKQSFEPKSLAELVPELTPQVVAAVSRSLSTKPDERFLSCAAFAAAFREGLR